MFILNLSKGILLYQRSKRAMQCQRKKPPFFLYGGFFKLGEPPQNKVINNIFINQINQKKSKKFIII
jgi:hypothetical protein